MDGTIIPLILFAFMGRLFVHTFQRKTKKGDILL